MLTAIARFGDALRLAGVDTIGSCHTPSKIKMVADLASVDANFSCRLSFERYAANESIFAMCPTSGFILTHHGRIMVNNLLMIIVHGYPGRFVREKWDV
ncbi:MAG: hypothetical protein WA921_14475 [Ahrensia sp.]